MKVSHTRLESKLKEKFKTLPAAVAPGFRLQAYLKGELCVDLDWGQTWKFYDLASLTKIIFTVSWYMHAVDTKKINISKSIQHYLPWYKNQTSIQHFLSHDAGSIWWKPFYKQIDLSLDVEGRKSQLKRLLKETPLKKQKTPVYSDLDFFLLGFALEEVYGQSWQDLYFKIAESLYLDHEMFFQFQSVCPFSKIQKKQIAPTGMSEWRGHQLQGDVNDDNAWTLGGVAPHAGLFSTIDAVSFWGLKMRSHLFGKDRSWCSQKTLQKFITKQTGDWALGFMRPTFGTSSAGKYFSLKSFGHTGFTGTSWWLDPQKDLMVTLLSNRTHPTVHNKEFNQWRPQIYNWVVESLESERIS